MEIENEEYLVAILIDGELIVIGGYAEELDARIKYQRVAKEINGVLAVIILKDVGGRYERLPV